MYWLGARFTACLPSGRRGQVLPPRGSTLAPALPLPQYKEWDLVAKRCSVTTH